MKTKEIAQYITEWLRNYSDKSHTNGFVIGISGGIDSAVTSSLCALTGKKTLVLEMPIRQEQSQVTRAVNHIAWLKKQFPNVSAAKIDLTPTFDTIENTLLGADSNEQAPLALANTRARLRMTTLYYMAQMNGLLVAGTGNKVEDFGVGFFTKYGDGGVDISPIADLMKTEVWELGRELGILQEIIDAKPTDGLWGDNRSDEDQLGASYPQLEWAMQQVEAGKKAEDFSGEQKRVMEIYIKAHQRNLHKMVPIPVCDIPKELK